jgi:hypothetical protein
MVEGRCRCAGPGHVVDQVLRRFLHLGFKLAGLRVEFVHRKPEPHQYFLTGRCHNVMFPC